MSEVRAALPLAVILLAFPINSAAAQSNLERVVNGWDTPSHDYDLIHQRIEVSSFDWDSTSFDGRVTTTVVAKRAGFDAVRLDMEGKLAVRAVTGRPSEALKFDRPGDTLVVRLSRPVAWGDTVLSSTALKNRPTCGLTPSRAKRLAEAHAPRICRASAPVPIVAVPPEKSPHPANDRVWLRRWS